MSPNMPRFNSAQLLAHIASTLLQICKQELTEHAKSSVTNTELKAQIHKHVICIPCHVTVLRHTQNGVIWAQLLTTSALQKPH